MKVGFNLLLWTTHVTEDHHGLLARLKATGYEGVEIPIFDGDLDHYRRLSDTLDEIGLERTGLAIIPTPEVNPLSDDAAARKAGLAHMNSVSDRAAALGAPLVCGPLHQPLGHFTGSPPTAEERRRAVAFHRAAGDHAAGHGVTLAVEALNRFENYFLTTMGDLVDYLNEVDHPAVRGMYDTFHANIEEKDPVGCIAPALAHISHVHISENDRGTPGSGHVNWSGVFTALKRGGYDGWLTIEAFGRTLPALAAATRVWRDFFPNEEDVYEKGVRHIRSHWQAA